MCKTAVTTASEFKVVMLIKLNSTLILPRGWTSAVKAHVTSAHVLSNSVS